MIAASIAADKVGVGGSRRAARTKGTLEVDHAGPDVHPPNVRTVPVRPTGATTNPTSASTDCSTAANDVARSPAALALSDGAVPGWPLW